MTSHKILVLGTRIHLIKTSGRDDHDPVRSSRSELNPIMVPRHGIASLSPVRSHHSLTTILHASGAVRDGNSSDSAIAIIVLLSLSIVLQE